MITINTFIQKESHNTWIVSYRHGNKTIRVDRFKKPEVKRLYEIDVKDPLNWDEEIGIKKTIPRDLKPISSYYFKDYNDIWVKVGHSMDSILRFFKQQ